MGANTHLRVGENTPRSKQCLIVKHSNGALETPKRYNTITITPSLHAECLDLDRTCERSHSSASNASGIENNSNKLMHKRDIKEGPTIERAASEVERKLL